MLARPVRGRSSAAHAKTRVGAKTFARALHLGLMTRPSISIAPLLSQTDSQLLQAWLNGDPRAPTVLIDRHYDSLIRFFAKRVGRRDVEDLAQATVLACLECRTRVRGEGSFRSLLFGIARNMLKRHEYAQQRARRPVERELLPAEAPHPLMALLHEDECARLHAAIAGLPDDRRGMLEAHYWGRVMLKDIAIEQGTCLNTVKAQMFRARRQLAQALD